jgi:tRNA(fMet)-specific endonuclease VapC
MSRYLLDTDTVTLYQFGHPGVVERVLAHQGSDLHVAVITVEEQLTGWYTKLRKAKKRDQLARAYQRLTEAVTFLSGRQVVTFTEPAIQRYDQLRSDFRHLGKGDLRIAAIAQEGGFTVVSRNLRDFRQIPGLQVEDWTQ